MYNRIILNRYIQWLMDDLQIEQESDWYAMEATEIRNRGGSGLLARYGSPSELVRNVFPNIDWKPWLFNEAGRNFWEIPRNRRIFLDWIAETLKVGTLDSWYKVRKSNLMVIIFFVLKYLRFILAIGWIQIANFLWKFA
jgi:hypothetical protein